MKKPLPLVFLQWDHDTIYAFWSNNWLPFWRTILFTPVFVRFVFLFHYLCSILQIMVFVNHLVSSNFILVIAGENRKIQIAVDKHNVSFKQKKIKIQIRNLQSITGQRKSHNIAPELPGMLTRCEKNRSIYLQFSAFTYMIIEVPLLKPVRDLSDPLVQYRSVVLVLGHKILSNYYMEVYHGLLLVAY